MKKNRSKKKLSPYEEELLKEIRKYRRVSTERKLLWLEEMRSILSENMTPKLRKQWEYLRQKGY
ncbi:MAG: hypothetical protein ABIE74_00875 [Pseudomonadota bacterium]